MNKKKTKNITKKRRIGDLGEEITCGFLMKQGFKVKDRNYLKKYGEIDIVAFKDNIYYFIEVKSVSCESFNENKQQEYRPEDNVHNKKRMRLANVIQAYISDKNISYYEWEFLVAIVTLNMKERLARVKIIHDTIRE